MSSKKNESELLNFRPRELAAKIEAVAKRNDCSKSDIMRRALEMYLDLEPLQPLAIYLGAASHFGAVATAAYWLGLISEEALDNLSSSLATAEAEVRKKLDPLFRKCYPGEMTPDEFSKAVRDKMFRKEDLTDEDFIGPEHVEHWNSALNSFGHFPDLQEAKRALMRRVNPELPDPLEGSISGSGAPLRRSKKKKRAQPSK